MAISRRPPFAALVAFEAVLRHASMTRAADELSLTQSAVSHRIKALERHFKTRLIDRLNPGLRPTAAGLRLIGELAPLLRRIEALRVTRDPGGDQRPFRLGLGEALFNWWLSPRLPALAAAFPGLAFEVVTFTTATDVARLDIDLGLYWLPRADLTGAERLFPPETVFPVIATTRARGRDSWRRDAALIDKRGGDGLTGREWSWSSWLAPEDMRAPILRFRDVNDSLRAALDGNGVALARSLLAADALAEGRLTRLAPEGQPCSKIQVARWPDAAAPIAADVAEWIIRAATRTLAARARAA